jgi:hypothetical protein
VFKPIKHKKKKKTNYGQYQTGTFFERQNMKTVTTKQLAKLLGVRPGAVHSAIYNGRIKPPAINKSGEYHWSEKDVQAVSLIMTGKPFNEKTGQNNAA